MKKLSTLLILTVLVMINSIPLFAQWQGKLIQGKMAGTNYTLKEISKAFDDYWTPYDVKGGFYFNNGVRTKASGWKQFKRSQWYWEQRVNPSTGEFPVTTSPIEFSKSQFRLNKSAGKTSNASWTNIGTNSSTSGYAGIGRINCVAFHPSDASTYWVGSPAGGIWKTADNGSNWTVLNNNMPSLGVSDIAIPNDYTTSNTIYIATGDRNGGSMWSLGTGRYTDNASIGVYKTTNGGTNWTATGLTFSTSNKLIGRLLIASNNTTLFASTTDGIYKSTNSGASWTLVLNLGTLGYLNTFVIDMEFKPGDFNTIYASTKAYWDANRIFRSIDGGTTWTVQFVGTAQLEQRIELAVTANDPTYVYAVVSYQNGNGTPLKSILKSTNSGDTFPVIWDGIPVNHNLLGYESTSVLNSTEGQGSYDLCIAASPADKNTVFIGGINTWYSADGGSTWNMKTHWSTNSPQVVHADKHFLAFQSSTVLFECNDGGIYRASQTNSSWSDPGSNFVDKTNGLVISQIYRLGVSKSDATKVLNGLQDNGSKLYNNGTWSDATGGDGMECIIDHTTPANMYATYTEGTIYRSTDAFAGGVNVNYPTISDNIESSADGRPGAWVTPYIMDPTSSTTLYAGYGAVLKTTNSGTNWTKISSTLSGTNKLRSLAIAPSNTAVIYAADLGKIWKTTDATAGTPTWTEITGTLPVASLSLTYIAVKANDPLTVWVTFGGYTAGSKVFQSVDGGTSWTNISGTLPNVPVLCIVQSTRTTSQLFIGTDAGVYAKDGTNDWILYNDGMPIVPVTELEFYYGAAIANDRLRAATFGRGLWESAVPAVLPVELISFTGVPTQGNDVQLNWITATEINNYGFEIQRSTGNDDWIKIEFVQGHGNSNSPKFYSYLDHPSGRVKFFYRLKQIDFNGEFEFSDVMDVTIGNPSDFVVHQNFPNPFNPTTTIKYELPITGFVTIKLFDSIGREVRTLLNKQESAGYHEIIFDGAQFASGVYYYSIQTGNLLKTKKMLLLK